MSTYTQILYQIVFSTKEKDKLIEYVKIQKTYHKIKTFREEFIELLNEHEIEFDEKYLY